MIDTIDDALAAYTRDGVAFDDLSSDRQVAAVLRTLRNTRDESILKLAYRVGYHENTIQRWESGGAYTLEGFAAWCAALGVKPSAVLRRCGL